MKERTIESGKILYSAGSNDECYTPEYGVIPIIKYLPKKKIIWCPFDKSESQFVKVLEREKFKIIHSHIDEGYDFYKYEPKSWEIIVSNPPFTNKRKIIERCISFNKSFALLLSNTIMNDKYPLWSFYEQNKTPQILKFNTRIEFIQPNVEESKKKKITFQSAYYCYNLLPNNFILEPLNKPKKERR